MATFNTSIKLPHFIHGSGVPRFYSIFNNSSLLTMSRSRTAVNPVMPSHNLNNTDTKHCNILFIKESCTIQSLNKYILGFSADQFAFDDPKLGNKVTLVSERGVVIPCSVIETDTSPTRITCETG